MSRSAAAVLFLTLGCASVFLVSAAAGEVPPLSELRKPVEAVQELEDDEPILPSAVGAESMVGDLTRLCPDGAVWFVSVPDAERLVSDFGASASGAFIAEPAVKAAFKNNRFGLGFLFSDLPASVIMPERISTVAAVLDLSNALAQNARKMAMACYIDDDGKFDFLFLFDVGSDRLPAFGTMGEWETYFFLTNPGVEVIRGNHAGSYLDTWQIKEEDGSRVRAEISAGFAENVAVVSNNAALAAESMALLRGGASLADSSWGRRLSASVSASASADAIAFLRMDGLLRGLRGTPIARDAVARWADYLGYGNRDGEAIYYGLEFTESGSRETFLLPSAGPSAPASLIELIAKRIRPAPSWTSLTVLPYQPNPSLFFAALLEGRQLGGILRSDRRLFGSSDEDSSFMIPPEARNLFTNDLMAILTGEVGMAFYPSETNQPSWIMVLPCSSSPDSVLPRIQSTIERTGASIHTVSEQEWRTSVCWTVVNTERFRRVNGEFLVIASHGELVLAVIDQLISGSSFATNKDLAAVLSQSEGEQGMIFYVNSPEIVVRQYPHLSAIMRQLYPRASGLNSRPPLALMRRYAKGILGVITPSAGEDFTRVTVQAPLPTFGMLGASIVLSFPRSLREDGRRAMEKSSENLKDIWLRLQLYASRFGHFPDSLEDLAAEIRSPDFTNEMIRSLFTAPAARSRMDPREAAQRSYSYLSGITPSDEPDIPLVYEAQPWSEDFSGQFPAQPGRGKSESGEYLPFRQYVRLDGRVVIVPEKVFQEKILPRLRERE